MADVGHRCFVGGLAWATTNHSLGGAFSQFGEVIESRIINDRETGRSRGFGFVTFKDEKAMRDAIEGMNGQSLDGRSITVNEAQSRGGGTYGGSRTQSRRNQRSSVVTDSKGRGCNASKYPAALSRHTNFKHRRHSNSNGNRAGGVCALGDQSARLKTSYVTAPDGTRCTFSRLVSKHDRCIERDSRQKMTEEDWASALAFVENLEKAFGLTGVLQKDEKLWGPLRKVRPPGILMDTDHLDGCCSPL